MESMSEIRTTIVEAFQNWDFSRHLAEDKGVAAGGGVVDTSLKLYLVQIIIIIGVCQTVNFIMKPTHQPRVIAEIIGGIMLGPSFLGKIPGFTDTLFPADSLTALSLTATLGLTLFLFVVGLELDPSLLRMNVKKSFSISIGGQLTTWSLSIPVSYLMYQTINDAEDTNYPEFLLFIGVAMSVTAFPVLSRILSEQRLLGTRVGMSTISSAAFDDVTAWSMLSLVISLVNAGSPEEALWVFLIMLGFVIFMLTAGRRMLKWTFDYLNIHEHVSHSVLSCIILMVLGSAWFTQIIGVDAIFGAFIAGLIIPRQGPIASVLIHKIEDVVSVVLLPLYFAKSGLKTDFSSLTTASVWGTALLVILASSAGKIIGCSTFAKIAGMTKRESICVGVLMNARGLVELIILNVGYDAGVIGKEVFTIMILMAVTTTFMATPLAAFIMPPKYHIDHDAKTDAVEKAVLMAPLREAITRLAPDVTMSLQDIREKLMSEVRILVCLQGSHIQLLTSSMAAIKLLRQTGGEVRLARLLEDTNTLSADMVALNGPMTLNADPITSSFQTFARRIGIEVMPHMIVSTQTSFSIDVLMLAQKFAMNTILVPWDPPQTSPTSYSGSVLSEVIIDAGTVGSSVAVVLERGSFSQAPPIILVPFLNLSASECEALILAIMMSWKTNSTVLALMVGVEIDGTPLQTISEKGILLSDKMNEGDDSTVKTRGAMNKQSSISVEKSIQNQSINHSQHLNEGQNLDSATSSLDRLRRQTTNVTGAKGLMAAFEESNNHINDSNKGLSMNSAHGRMQNRGSTVTEATSPHANHHHTYGHLSMTGLLHTFMENIGNHPRPSGTWKRKKETEEQLAAARSLLLTVVQVFHVKIAKTGAVDINNPNGPINSLIKEMRGPDGRSRYSLVVCGSDGHPEHPSERSEAETVLGNTGAQLMEAFPYMSVMALHSPEEM